MPSVLSVFNKSFKTVLIFCIKFTFNTSKVHFYYFISLQYAEEKFVCPIVSIFWLEQTIWYFSSKNLNSLKFPNFPQEVTLCHRVSSDLSCLTLIRRKYQSWEIWDADTRLWGLRMWHSTAQRIEHHEIMWKWGSLMIRYTLH